MGRKVGWGQAGYTYWKKDRYWTDRQIDRHGYRYSERQTDRKVGLGTGREDRLQGRFRGAHIETGMFFLSQPFLTDGRFGLL